MYLVDTDWIVDYLKGKEIAVKKLQELFDDGLYVSIISVAEIQEGISGAKNNEEAAKSFSEFLEGVIVLNIDEIICKKFGEIRNNLRKSGNLIGDFDILIASTALVRGLRIITNNDKHFRKIKGLTFM